MRYEGSHSQLSHAYVYRSVRVRANVDRTRVDVPCITHVRTYVRMYVCRYVMHVGMHVYPYVRKRGSVLVCAGVGVRVRVCACCVRVRKNACVCTCILICLCSRIHMCI